MDQLMAENNIANNEEEELRFPTNQKEGMTYTNDEEETTLPIENAHETK
jgi:hypothetical protein